MVIILPCGLSKVFDNTRSVETPYQLTLKFLDIRKYADLNLHDILLSIVI